MTDNEDTILDRAAGSAKLLLLWQLLAAFMAYILTGLNPWFWIPAACSLIAAGLSLLGLLWILPGLRRAIWESGDWRCRRCSADVVDARCACTESPSPWEPKP